MSDSQTHPDRHSLSGSKACHTLPLFCTAQLTPGSCTTYNGLNTFKYQCRQAIPFEGFIGSVQTGMQFALLGNTTQAQAPGSTYMTYYSPSSTADEAPYASLSPGAGDALPNAALGPDAAQQLMPASRLPGSSPVLSDPGTVVPAFSFADNNQSSATPAGAPSTHADPNIDHTPFPSTSPGTSASGRDAQGPSGDMLADSIMPSLSDSPESPNPSSLAPLPSNLPLPAISLSISPSPLARLASSSTPPSTTNTTMQSGSVPNPNASLPHLDPAHSTSAPALLHSLMTGMTDQAEPPSASTAFRASLINPNSTIAAAAAAAAAAAPPRASSIVTSTPSPSSSSDAKALLPAPAPASNNSSPGPAAAPGDAQAQNIIQTDPVKEHTTVIVLASLLGAVVAAMLAGVSCQDTSHEHRLRWGQTFGVVCGLSLFQPLSLN